ncbi:hypothetical protein K438DRAFT_1862086 [Mycena galopus ATCC 62051]|nr:hypothetical protein K438DRAFT_1862086 [Mycena galopus ATCC 62051]
MVSCVWWILVSWSLRRDLAKCCRSSEQRCQLWPGATLLRTQMARTSCTLVTQDSSTK